MWSSKRQGSRQTQLTEQHLVNFWVKLLGEVFGPDGEKVNLKGSKKGIFGMSDTENDPESIKGKKSNFHPKIFIRNRFRKNERSGNG